MAEFFAMGGYAAFVWPAYGATALVMAGLVVWIVRSMADVRTRVAALSDTHPDDKS